MLKEFYAKYKQQLFWLGIVLVVYFLYFHNLWAYHLLDVDETRYVDMAAKMHRTKDFLTLYLNGEYFFEKPPLYFWFENISFYIFNTINEFTARIPTCIEGIIAGITLFFVTKKYTKNFKLAIISALILLSSVEFVMLSKIAILDILLASMTTIAILLGFMTFCVEEKNKKYCWWGFYLFTALAVLAKGIPGIALPVGTMFFAGLYSKKIGEYFRPQYMLPGIVIFLLVSLPWHIIMLNTYDPLFFNEYVMKHHLARFMGSDVINRQQPFWFYIPVILWGVLPYVASFIAFLVEKCAKIKSFSYKAFSELNPQNQFLALTTIAVLVTFLFFSSSGTKLVTYILPIYPFLAVLMANYWLEYIENNEHKKGIVISSYIFNIIFIVAGVGFFVTTFFLKDPVGSDLATIRIPVLIATVLFPVAGIIAMKKENRTALFISYLLFMTFLSGFGLHKFLEMDYRFGQNDLIKFAKYAKKNNLDIVTYGTGARYSLLYYSEKNAKFDIAEENKQEFFDAINNPQNIVIIRKKHFDELPSQDVKIIKKGRKYWMITKN